MDEEQSVDQLLHDVSRKRDGACFARSLIEDHAAAAELEREADELFALAERLDPRHADPAWGEFSVREVLSYPPRPARSHQ